MALKIVKTGEKKKAPEVQQFQDKQGNDVIVLVLNPASRFPFRFGLGKARLILDNINVIEEFVCQFGEGEDALDDAA